MRDQFWHSPKTVSHFLSPYLEKVRGKTFNSVRHCSVDRFQSFMKACFTKADVIQIRSSEQSNFDIYTRFIFKFKAGD